MTTVINNPGESGGSDASGGAGVMIGAVIVVLAIVVVLILAIPYFRGRIDTMSTPKTPIINPTINVQLPNPPTPTTPPATVK